MRFCPFCSAENPSEASHCAACARRLPPLPPRRQKTQPVPAGAGQVAQAANAGLAAPVPVPDPGAPRASSPPLPTHRARSASIPPAPVPVPVPVPAAPVPAPAAPVPAPPAPAPAPAPAGADLRPATLVPAPAALRRPTAPPEPRSAGAPDRRRTDSLPPPPVAAPSPDPDPAGVGDETVTTVAAPPAPAITSPRVLDTITPLPPPPIVAAPPSQPPPSPPHKAPTPTQPPREPTVLDPPPTRIARPDQLADRPFTPPKVLPIPEVPEPGPLNLVRYSITFLRARWQRRGAIKVLGEEIKQDTAALDLVLGTLGRQARQLKVDNRALAAENAAIDATEERKARLDQANAELNTRKIEETSKFEEIERERTIKVTEAERVAEEASRELASYEGQRRSLRDKRKEVERRQKAYLKAAEDRDTEAGNSQMGDSRSELRRAAEGHRREAAELEPERQDLERRIAALDRPIAGAQAKVDAARAELESARRSLNDAREGHRHRLAEIEAEQGRKHREVALADAEVQRRLVTLGTLVNLNRIEHAGFDELYERIDRLRAAIGARTTEIDKLTAEREAYDKGSLVRGFVWLGGGVVAVITFIAIILAIV